jgi:3-oxoacyl-[acyl-carrier-protein] synthase II
MADAGLTGPVGDPERFGVVVGSGIGGLQTTEEQHTVLMQKGPSRLSPFMIPSLIVNMASGIVSMEYGLQGPNYAPVSACATSAHAIGEATQTIMRGDAKAIIAGGSEAGLLPIGVAGFAAMKALSTRNDAPQRASRPFDRERDGFVMAEAAALLVLEDYELARARGARIYAEILGYGITNDAYNMIAPLPDGQQSARAMTQALCEARIEPRQVDYLNAHASSTKAGDTAELLAIQQAFGSAVSSLAISGTKSMHGHALGASGAEEMAITVLALHEDRLPPTVNLDQPDPGVELDLVPQHGRDQQLAYAVSNSFGFGGINSSIVIGQVD